MTDRAALTGDRPPDDDAVRIVPADAHRWPEVTQLLGADGGYAGCWCSFWRLTNAELAGRSGEQNRELLEGLVTSGDAPGLVLRLDGVPVGWCQVAPRAEFQRLFHTRGLELTDPADPDVWSIVCVYVAKTARGRGLAGALVAAAVDRAAARGATVVEAYPVTDPGTGRRTQLSSGTVSMFEQAGFEPAAPATGRRVLMRRVL
ncbi:GCN5-related protein N-acetyltransferase [Beutenbergia cavernae DSM 12333]|uniref:GCN5-related protein N-acetyltransferase n=1 Tax=Beutenbergia cavernae (strain ATCC BAA-8 / DSM 12333 / CCUG 43141 / JCM 11478 / NBRC 16432 / NCIMB 13614 / HKI 0122) TaxID=471853 RepID=C5BVE2_BEUC1|nr:GNAT family N-acetyltransferase [Beutenbergia cavernae]ACQ80529.1 GCN5-related protein N-acetyltransferase [Beutenbergia cavernae DSM 12333]